jgi:CRISPR-associated exonuclease Cas4
MYITPTHINYFHLCRRKLWLFSNGINMEQTSQTVAEGKLIGESSYPQRPEKYTELELEGAKIDYYDAKNKVVHEVKKSDKVEHAHVAQVKYYLYLLDKIGISDATGVIEYPKLRQTQEVTFGALDKKEVDGWIKEVNAILEKDECPPLLNKPICKSCSYFDFCYTIEDEP